MIPHNEPQHLSQAAFWYSAYPAIILAFIAVIAGAFMRDIVITACMESACPVFMPYIVPGIVVIFIIAALVQPVLNFVLFSYTLTDRTITINSGILYRQYETIDFNRIQTLDLERGPLLWLFGLTEVRLWTASADQLNHEHDGPHAAPDTTLILERGTAEILRDHIHNAKQPVAAPVADATTPVPAQPDTTTATLTT
jgi:uncharacterized membrane protein YdbT with pleckstrin-like domain